MGMMSRNKGKRGEREVIQLMAPVVADVYRAHELDVPALQRNTLQSDKGGFDIVGLEWLALEVKYVEQLNVEAWWRQTLAQAGRTHCPVLVYRSNGKKWKVCMWGRCGELGDGVRVRVTVDINDFLAWLHVRLSRELSK